MAKWKKATRTSVIILKVLALPLAQYGKIENQFEHNKKTKRIRTKEHVDMEKATLKWFKQRLMDIQVLISEPLLKAKGIEVATFGKRKLYQLIIVISTFSSTPKNHEL